MPQTLTIGRLRPVEARRPLRFAQVDRPCIVLAHGDTVVAVMHLPTRGARVPLAVLDTLSRDFSPS